MLERRVKALCEQGTQALGLAALDADAIPDYHRQLAGRLVERGAHVGAMTPAELAAWIGARLGT